MCVRVRVCVHGIDIRVPNRTFLFSPLCNYERIDNPATEGKAGGLDRACGELGAAGLGLRPGSGFA